MNNLDGEYGLNDKVVLDSLEGISTVCEGLEYALVGGLAAALYCYPNADVGMLRKTDDVDIITLHRLGFKEKIGKELEKYFSGIGYDSKFRKVPGNYEILITKDDMYNPFLLHFSRYSEKSIMNLGGLFKRELENAKNVRIPESDREVLVIRPEDIIPPKLHARREKDMFDINLMIRYGPILDLDELKKNDLYWCGGSQKLVDADLEEIKKIIQKTSANGR